MAITVTAGADVDYVFTDLPLPDVALNAVGVPHSGSMATWAWTLVGGPEGHGAFIQAPTSQNTFLVGVDIAGDYVCMASGTDTAGNATSTDYRTATQAQFKIVSVKMENGLDQLSEKQKGWWSRYKATMALLDAALARVGAIPIEVAVSSVSNVGSETQFNGINITTPLVDDWIKVEFFVNIVVDGTDAAYLRWRVAPAAGDIVADGVLLQELEITTSGSVFVEMSLHISATGAVLDGACVDSVSLMTTSVGMPASQYPEVKSGVPLDITGDLQLSLTLTPNATWGVLSSATTTKILGGRNNSRRI